MAFYDHFYYIFFLFRPTTQHLQEWNFIAAAFIEIISRNWIYWIVQGFEEGEWCKVGM